MLLACADDDIITTGNKSDKGAIVSFSVQDAQQNTLTQEGNMETTRAAVAARLHTQGLTPEDLMSRKIVASTTEGLDVCLIESTIEGVNPVKVSPQTRANITSSIDADFSSLGYRGTTSTSISPTPDWFYNVKTSPDGTLASPYYWDWTGNRFGIFYGIYPEVTDTYSKLTLSPSTHLGTPYVDFEVETDVTQQKDLMTACSGIVEYTTQGIAPMSTLNFRHALTAIRFAVGQNLSWAKTIDKVEIHNAKNKGRYTLSNNADVTNHEGKSYDFTEEPLGFKYTKWETSAFDKPRMVRLHIEQTIGNSGEKQKTVVTVKQNNGGIKEGIATYYQFGRKDAFPGIEVVPQGYFSKIEGAQSISTTIQHPDVLYYNNIQDDWNLHNERYNNLKAINCKTIKTPDDTPVVKTVYDPCPVGFHIPHHKAWTGFTTTGGETSIISQWNIDGGHLIC